MLLYNPQKLLFHSVWQILPKIGQLWGAVSWEPVKKTFFLEIIFFIGYNKIFVNQKIWDYHLSTLSKFLWKWLINISYFFFLKTLDLDFGQPGKKNLFMFYWFLFFFYTHNPLENLKLKVGEFFWTDGVNKTGFILFC